MRSFRRGIVAGVVLFGAFRAWASPPPGKRGGCRTEVLEGEVEDGKAYEKPIGGGLLLLLQPIHSGWILRVIADQTPAGTVGVQGFHDYAELATPPYESVTPLSLSTDFSFRAQDAVGWNPRRFRFATSPASFARLNAAFEAFERGGSRPTAAVQRALALEVAASAEGVLTIVDSRLVPGTADQSRMAASVSSNFTSTAHTLDLPAAGKATPLGKIVGLHFRVELELPSNFQASGGLKIVSHLCGSR